MVNLKATFIALHTICFIINIPPLIWHIINKNIPAVSLLVYLEIMMINGLVAAIVWGGSDYFSTWSGKGWCDIMVRIQIATSVGIPSSVSCVSFNLLLIFLTNKVTTFWYGNKWVKPTVEVLVSIIFPFFISGITYFAQTNRYMLAKYSGCYAPLASESITILIFYLWVFFWSFVGIILCIITLILFFKKRKAAKDILVCTNSGLSVKRFIRLLLFCILVISASIIFSAIIGSRLTVQNGVFFSSEVLTRESWGYIFRITHSDELDINKWVLISISFVCFFVFGVGEDAGQMYIAFINKLPYGDRLVERLHILNASIKKKTGGGLLTNENQFMLRFYHKEESDGEIDDQYKRKGDDDSDFFDYDKISDDIELGSVDKGERKDRGRYAKYARYYEERRLYTGTSGDNLSFDVDDKYELDILGEHEHDLGSLATPATAKTTDTLTKYYNDENLRYQLEEAKREVEAEGHSRELKDKEDNEVFDELKYLYF